MKLEKIIEKLKEQGISPQENLYKGAATSASEMKRWGLAWLEAAAETEREEAEKAQARKDIQITALDYLEALLHGLEIDEDEADAYIDGAMQEPGEWSQAVFSSEFTLAVRNLLDWIERRQASIDPDSYADDEGPDGIIGYIDYP